MPSLGNALGLPFKGTQETGIPFPSWIIQDLYGGVESDTDNTVNDIKNPLVITDKAKYVENNTINCNASGAYIPTPSEYVLISWTTLIRFPAYTPVNSNEFAIGSVSGAGFKNIGFRHGGITRPFYRQNGGTYYDWDGTGNTIAVDPTLGGEFVFTSNGTNIYLYVDSVYKGYVTPSISTELIVSKYGNGYSTASNWFPANIYRFGLWSGYSADGSVDVKDAFVHNIHSEGSGDIYSTAYYEDIELVFLGGQSLMVGSADKTLPSSEYLNQSDYYYYYSLADGGFESFTGGNLSPVDTDIWSYELLIGKYLTDTFGSKKRAFVKVAMGGQTLDKFLPGQSLYTDIVDTINQAITNLRSRGYNPTMSHFIWDQGQADAQTEVLANAYYSNFYTLWNSLKTDSIVTDGTRLIIARVYTEDGRVYLPTVRAAQEQLGNELGAWFNCDNSELLPDLVHQTINGKFTSSQAAFAEMINYVSSGSYPKTDPVTPVGSVNYVTDDNAPSWNQKNGFRVAIQGTPPYIPALDDGSAAADGNPLTNEGGVWHNRSESKVLQTTAALLDRGAWSDDGLTMDARSYDELNTYYNSNNGQDGVWFKELANGSLERGTTYDATKYSTLTPEQYNRLVSWFGGTPAPFSIEYVDETGVYHYINEAADAAYIPET